MFRKGEKWVPKKERRQTYDVEISMIQGGKSSSKLTKKRKVVKIEFIHHNLVPFYHHDIKPLIIIGAVGRTLIRRIYVDNERSINIINEN